MGEKSNISNYRGILDKTLASKELKNEETLKTLVKNQILTSSEFKLEEHVDNLVERRTRDVAHFLDMLRSASVDDAERLESAKESRASWKVKQDTEEIRVMYREGPEGTPLHTLLVEGYVDGPVDVCLCISWESSLYKKWWPQTAVPSFRITSSQCLQKVRVGEQISLVRMKAWPLSAREALIHYFEFHYFQDGLIVVLLNSITDLESIDHSTHGFTRNGIPDQEDVVRIDVVGGFALQKVSASRSYFRTIANMDIKLDFVPPAFINFLSRQLIGSGFKLYKKEVASVSRGDEDYAKALKDPLYERIREALYSNNLSLTLKKRLEPEEMHHGSNVMVDEPRKNIKISEVGQEVHGDDQVAKPENTDAEERKNETHVFVEENSGKYKDVEDEEKVLSDNQVIRSAEETVVGYREPLSEIEEIEETEEEGAEKSECLDKGRRSLGNPHTNQLREKGCNDDKKKVDICPEVEKALGTLEKAISIVREHKSNINQSSFLSITIEKPSLEKDAAKESSSLKSDQIHQNGRALTRLSKKELSETTSYEPRISSGSRSSRRSGSNSYARESNYSKVAPASPDEYEQDPSDTHNTAFNSAENQTRTSSLEETTAVENVLNANANGVNEEKTSTKKNKKLRYCCLHRIYGQLVTRS